MVRDESGTRANSKKLKIIYRRDVKKYSFPHKSITTWNGVDEEIMCAKSIHESKDTMSLAWLLSCISLLGKYN